jgi:DNA-binding transcriptional MerR regulator
MTDLQRPFFSIGEVLNVLKDAFPDVTVSKIRFLESEGLIAPERTDSGYRRFTDEDIERLRFILRLQREQFLPLKVIRERLDEVDRTGGQTKLTFEESGDTEVPEAESPREAMMREGTGASFSAEELARASGLSEEQVGELTSFRLLSPTEIREAKPDGTGEGEPQLRFHEHDLEVAKLSRALLDLGLDPRHLRVFRVAADRWADLAEQMVSPLVRQRNPEARKAASEKVRELVRVGGRLMRALLRESVGV